MKKLVIIVSLLLAILLPGQVFAFDPPLQDTSANATDIILWHGDDATINLNTDGLEDIIGVSVASIIGFCLLLVIVIIGFWRYDRLMLIIGGFGFVIFGFSLWSSIWYLSITTVIAGIYMVFKAFMLRGTAR